MQGFVLKVVPFHLVSEQRNLLVNVWQTSNRFFVRGGGTRADRPGSLRLRYSPATSVGVSVCTRLRASALLLVITRVSHMHSFTIILVAEQNTIGDFVCVV